MGTFDFLLNHHGDTVLLCEGDLYNFGYIHYKRIPVVVWLYGLQVAEENYFGNGDAFLDSSYSFSDDEEHELEGTIDYARILPVSDETFEQGFRCLGVDRFCAGVPKTWYRWGYDIDSEKLTLTQYRNDSDCEKQILHLDAFSAKEFVLSYSDFLLNDEVLQEVITPNYFAYINRLSCGLNGNDFNNGFDYTI